MHYAVSTYTLFSKSIDVAVETLIADGWKHIEIMGEGNHHGRQLLQAERNDLEKMATHATENGITFGYHLPIEGFNPALFDQETIAIWEKCKQVIKILEPSYILFHPGANTSLEKGISSTVEFIKKAFEELPERGQIVIENVPKKEHQIGSSVEHLLAIIDQVKSTRLKIMLDVGHCYMNANSHFLVECEKTFPSLFGLHINDNHGEEDEHLQIGEGTIPFQELVDKLPNKNLTLVMETNTLERAEISKEKMEQLIKTKSEDAE